MLTMFSFIVTLQHEFEHQFFVKAFDLIERNDYRYKRYKLFILNWLLLLDLIEFKFQA